MESNETTAAVEDRPEPDTAPQAVEEPTEDAQGQEYEWEFETPFGKIEFEVEPKALFERKEKDRKEKTEREAAKKARAEERRLQRMGIPAGSEVVIVKRSNWLPVLTIFILVVVIVAAAYWLFGRPAAEDDEVPSEFLTDEAAAAVPQPSGGIVARIKRALREGQRASRQAQDEQIKRFKESTKS